MGWENTIARVAPEDLVAVEAQYHHSCMKKFSRDPVSKYKKGYRPASQVDEAMAFIYSYLEEHGEECQFSLDELCEQIQGYRPDMRTIKSRLLQKYDEDIIIVSRGSRPTMVCYKNTGFKILSEGWYAKKNGDTNEERLRVVKAAATIVLEDIRSQVYEMHEYPPSDRFLEDVTSVIPETLNTFIEGVILKLKRSSMESWRVKCSALCHAIIAATRPRSFLSPLQIGLGTFLYQKFGSKELLNILAALGFSASYHECVLFQLSAIMRPGIEIDLNAFSQFSFDNADFNTNTLDGFHTFHAMGGIQSITPRSSIVPDQTIPRLKKLPSAALVGEFGDVSLRTFTRRNKPVLSTLIIADLQTLNPATPEVLPSIFDLMWLHIKFTSGSQAPGWNGFMEQVTESLPYQRSFVLCLPFIKAPPSDYDTIYTALCVAAEKSKTLQQKTCFVTFDLPLYMKARDIIGDSNGNTEENYDLSIVEPVLGGFHLLMSFMGTIGYLMSGSGLKELWTTIYAPNSVDKMMSGHAYSRAVRAHILTHLAISHIIFQVIELSNKDKEELNNLLLDTNRSLLLSANENEAVRTLSESFRKKLEEIECNGATAKLWLQYFQMVCLIKRFIEAERMGNWQLHLITIQQMLPYFHASGHFPYAKACQLYLQDMFNLKERMDPEEYQNYTENGYFTIRRSDRFWAGIWTDMTIEQTLMRTMKSIGGLTHGRGITDSVLTKWTLGMVYLHNVCEAMEEYCGVVGGTSEQHVDIREARVCRDSQDLQKLLNWFAQHHPFPEKECVFSISTGIIGNSSINCHMAREVGTAAIQQIIGKTFASIHLKRKDRVLPLSTINSSIKFDDVLAPVNPLFLFQRICIIKKTEQQLQEYFHYELAPFPLSLFTEEGMRKGTKSSLYSVFEPIEHTPCKQNLHVVDGGHLLHKVRWHSNDPFSLICSKYIQYVKNKYGSNSIIVFDGYEAEIIKSTKTAERLRRSRIHKSAEVIFDETMKVTSSQERFLSNVSNKNRFIRLLKNKFEEANFVVKQAVEDADCLIVNTTLEMSSSWEYVYIVGEDIDLLVLLTALGQHYQNIYFLKPGKGTTSDKTYTSNSLKFDKTVTDNILFLHAFSGFDTTSSAYNQGKVKFLNTMKNHKSLSDIIEVFKNPDAEPDSVAAAGEKFLIALYERKKYETNSTLNSLRYYLFAKCATKHTFHLASLPPTSEAARLHSFRTYHQVQQWLGVEKSPLDWGWKISGDGLIPITSSKEPAPAILLKYIFCKCRKGCGSACSCRKAGLKCSRICTVCNGDSCSNTADILIQIDDDDDEFNEFHVLEDIQNTDNTA